MQKPHKPDNLIEFDVQDALAWDQGLDHTRIVAKVDHGHVTLTGSVPGLYDRARATEDAWSVGGVKTVDNELLVGFAGEVLNDVQLTEACQKAIEHDRRIPKGAVTATVVHGRVQLNGRVRNPFQRHAAELAVSKIDGVLAIDNLVAMSPEPIASDIAARINKAFERSAIIDETKIAVTNNGHEVYLNGVVGSYAAMREAIDTAWHAPGVYNVENHLVVEP